MRTAPALTWTCLALTALATGGAVHVARLGERVAELEGRPVADPVRVAALEQRVADLEAGIARSQTMINELWCSSARTRDVDAGLRTLEAALHEAARGIEEQRASIARIATLEEEAGPRAIDARFREFGASLEGRWHELGDLAARAEALAVHARAGLDVVQRGLEHNPERLWQELLGPTVQVSGGETVGSGVLVAAGTLAPAGSDATYVLTAWHVIRDLFVGDAEPAPDVPVSIYAPDGTARHVRGALVEHDPALDVALLRLPAGERIESGARLAPRSRLTSVRVFERIYAVGCPLGNDPIPTFGQIADTHHVVDGQGYWMVSAPTYIGNSGGGIFDAQTHELLALFTKIYTHGAVRPMVVPHMGLALPLTEVYDWLDRVGYAALEPENAVAQPQTAAAKR